MWLRFPGTANESFSPRRTCDGNGFKEAFLQHATAGLIFAGLVASPCYAAGMASTRVSPTNSEFITITTHTSKGFDAMVEALLPQEVAAQALTLKPYLFIVSNPSQQTVVAYCLKFTMSLDDGSTKSHFTVFMDPTAAVTQTWTVTGQYEQLVPGRQRVISISMVFNPEPRFNDISWTETYKQDIDREFPVPHLRSIEVEADAVILADGLLLGPDTADLATEFALRVRAQRALLGVIVTQVDRGQTLNSVFAALKDENSRKVDVMFSSGEEAPAEPSNNDDSVYVFGDILRLWRKKETSYFWNRREPP
jgi:hypothetical protein